ncbi:MAG TPA: biotin-dependent carboxyltransferase family protein [Candidatus Limnocylindria bacterium]|nr:biotin-dependent carboxyltransferase family protein [Candidatus Limnocylindria bacterium]
MLEVVDPGPLASVQDVLGRRDARRHGVPFGGAADPWSARLANRLVGNPEGAALIEVVAGDARFVLEADAIVAVTGGLVATIDGVPLPPSTGRRLAAGAQLRLGSGVGLRGYLAVSGGIDVEPVLGSRATDLRTGFGGHDGRALRAGDRLRIGAAGAANAGRWLGAWPARPIRITNGPQADPDLLRALTATTWTVAPAVDRTGVRLAGGSAPGGGEVPSQGLLPGAIQVPPDGAPILMLADCPVTGGYRVPACVIGADIGSVAQLRPGDPVELVEVRDDEARGAWLRIESSLAEVEPLGAAGDDGPGWAGAHH